jgi:hypothetical protein
VAVPVSTGVALVECHEQPKHPAVRGGAELPGSVAQVMVLSVQPGPQFRRGGDLREQRGGQGRKPVSQHARRRCPAAGASELAAGEVAHCFERAEADPPPGGAGRQQGLGLQAEDHLPAAYGQVQAAAGMLG